MQDSVGVEQAAEAVGDGACVQADVFVADNVDWLARGELGTYVLSRGSALRGVGEPHGHRPEIEILARTRGLLLDLVAGAQGRGELTRFTGQRLEPDADAVVGDR